MRSEWGQFWHLLGETDEEYHKAARKLRMTDSALQTLYAIRVSDTDCYPAQIARLAGVSRQTLNSALRGLEKQGLLYLEAGAGRTRAVRLTGAGERLCRQRVDPLIRMENEIWQDWAPAEREMLLRLTAKYLSELRCKVAALPPLPKEAQA